jgi:hypothetical protein
MKSIIYFSTFFLFLSCGQSSNTEKTLKSTNIDTTKTNQIESNDETLSIETLNTPVDVALTFIHSYVDNCNKMNKSTGIIEWVHANPLTTKNFKDVTKKIIEDAYLEDPEMGLGFDPIFDGQDYPDEGFELEEYDSITNFIVVKGENWDDYKLTLKVVLENDKWLVDGCGIINIPKEKRSDR